MNLELLGALLSDDIFQRGAIFGICFASLNIITFSILVKDIKKLKRSKSKEDKEK